MYTHELINLLKSFTDKELMWFGKFLNSPYFNSRKRIIDLFKVLKSYYPDFNAKSLTKENIYKRIYGNSVYNDSTFRNLMSDLLKLALMFLKMEGIEKNEVQASFYLTAELIKRGNYSLFRNIMTQSNRIIENEHKVDSDYFFNKYRILTDTFYINLLTRKVLKKEHVVIESEKIINGIICILSYFIVESIKHYDNLLNYSRTYNIKKNIDIVSHFLEIFDFEKLITYIRENSSQSNPVVEIYYNLLKAFANYEDEKYYTEYKKSVISNTDLLGVNDNYFLFIRLMDYNVVKKTSGMNTGINVESELFEIYDVFIKRELYKTDTNHYLSFDIYRNVLLNCISLKELDYMEKFIEDNSKKLLPNHVQSIENYSYAMLYFEKKLYNKALSCINKIKFDQFVYKLDMKNLQLKINYELGHFESAISIIDTYKHFLKNNTLLSENRRVMHSHFLNFTNQLIHFRIGSQKTSLNFIEDKIEKSKTIFDKVWLQDKIKELTDTGSAKSTDKKNTRKISFAG